jgi:hypothetical protein
LTNERAEMSEMLQNTAAPILQQPDPLRTIL